MNSKLALFVVSMLLLAACGAPTPTPRLSPVSTSPLASPLPHVSDTAFQIERPVIAGSTVVRGTGPAGVPIIIADITFMGDVLGSGTIGVDGTFAISVKPLDDGHRIGLILGDLTGTKWKKDDFYPSQFFGPGAMQFPQVGFFHDTALVTPK